jgi:hypothetical protein
MLSVSFYLLLSWMSLCSVSWRPRQRPKGRKLTQESYCNWRDYLKPQFHSDNIVIRPYSKVSQARQQTTREERAGGNDCEKHASLLWYSINYTFTKAYNAATVKCSLDFDVSCKAAKYPSRIEWKKSSLLQFGIYYYYKMLHSTRPGLCSLNFNLLIYQVS